MHADLLSIKTLNWPSIPPYYKYYVQKIIIFGIYTLSEEGVVLIFFCIFFDFLWFSNNGLMV